jgi:hypothetical protein
MFSAVSCLYGPLKKKKDPDIRGGLPLCDIFLLLLIPETARACFSDALIAFEQRTSVKMSASSATVFQPQNNIMLATYLTLSIRQNPNNDPNVGSAQSSSSSASGLLSTLAPVALIALIWFTLFLIFRKWFPRNYRPRTFLGSIEERERSPKLPDGLFSWFGNFFSVPDSYVLNHHSLDGYLFLRLLKMAVITCLVGCCITFPVLLPINITGGGGKSQLDILTLGNVTDNYWKLFAHAGCAYLFFGKADGRSSSTLLTRFSRLRYIYDHPREHLLHQFAPRLSSLTLLR